MFQSIAEIVFFGSYFIAWVSGEISNIGGKSDLWLSISAWAALLIVCLIIFANRGIVYRKPPIA